MARQAALPRFARTRLDGRAAWALESDRLRLQILEGGGHIASLALAGTRRPAGLNPLWKPPWKSMEPYRFSMKKDGPRYGNDSEARLLSGIRGHNLCFDYWCGPSPEETAQGLSFHGEAGLVRWGQLSAVQRGGELNFTCAAEMPASAESFTRRVRLRQGETVAYFEETAENLLGQDRAIGWVEHVTIGPPFLRRGETLVDLPATRGHSLDGALGRVPPSTEFEWPYIKSPAPGGAPIDLRVAAPEQRSHFNLALALDTERDLGFVAAATPRLNLLVAYVFRRQDFPWVNFWEQNRGSTARPWNGRTLSLGLEFGNTILHGSRRVMAAGPPALYGLPTYGWLPARGKQTVRYVALLAEIPKEYRGTADIQAGSGGLVIVERETNTAIRVECDTGFLGVAGSV